MAKAKRENQIILLDRIFLHLQNPRHETCETQTEVIEWMCRNEEVSQLARDIAQNGLSPLDQFGVIRDHETEGDDATYIAAEGNRRLCALKLLVDPDLAPSGKRAQFEKYAENWSPITELPCVIFEDQEDLDLWLKRRHHGKMNGVGQKEWNAEQKSRHIGSNSRNQVALAFLDYAEKEKLISAEDRNGRLTTVQRFLSNPVMRDTLGLESDPDNVKRNRTKEDFNLLATQFINDMLAEDPKVNSRQNKAKIIAYAQDLGATEGQSHKRVDAEPLVPNPEKPKSKKPQKPGKAKSLKRLPYRLDIDESLKALGNQKLISLYCSLCNVSLQDNTPLLAVGVWSFFETLTASAGRKPNNSFHAFLSRELLKKYGIETKEQVKPLRDAINRILDYGNTTKHHPQLATFNSEQLHNEMDSLGEVILKVIEDARNQTR